MHELGVIASLVALTETDPLPAHLFVLWLPDAQTFQCPTRRLVGACAILGLGDFFKTSRMGTGLAQTEGNHWSSEYCRQPVAEQQLSTPNRMNACPGAMSSAGLWRYAKTPVMKSWM